MDPSDSLAAMTRRKSTPPTLSEVARRAGVGTTTVSRVINGGHRVSPETLQRVQRAIEALGYVPNQAARILKGYRTRTVGLIIPSIADPFFSECAEAIQAVARANDSLLIVTTTQNDPRAEIDNINVLMEHRADGLIIAPANAQSQTLRQVVSALAVPIVSIDRPIAQSSVPAVVADNFRGAAVATQHLIDHGYKRILCLTGESTLYTIRERILGYRRTMEAAGLEVLLDTSVKDYRSAEYAIESLLSTANPPDAIFTLKNSTTIFAFESLQKFKVAIPGSVALLGYDDFELASTVRPSISVVEQPIEEIARVAAEALFERLLGSADGNTHSMKGGQITLAVRLVPRSSCGCAPRLPEAAAADVSPHAEKRDGLKARTGRRS
ncbi:MAG TPA: LacI family DNA-binding transcriptional regulator [Acidobacteriaceae bacterium]|jgi:LacI family transcriptional regulator|nr:LacI family DNA-binding transcriptional regulator [Acidobacteriaceae bacterium]